ncbi:hypothetical protein PR001_g7298 [Phytophthora rubi]|uniref:Retrotransposon gag domain-containing protein n=1 Tax=Phytophthora rubi TaxID=129364 RepID=A0A6A3NF79_9STRA|nr:hypothetical protein PR001_g7298 [Phytophthora rubi]KAE9048558.1 hypothetical protein PR002_g364 [Phytophthora rubi]
MYGERPDLAQAEWGVMQRAMQPGETFADFASGLRDAAGQNQVREETLLGQFYRGLEKTTRQLVKLAPTPTTLGEAVDKATRIDDSSYNVARGMRNIGQPWATVTTQAAVQMDGTTGAMRVIPGIGSMPADMLGVALAENGEAPVEFAYLTNPQGVFDKNSNVWVAPSGRTCN